MCVCRSSADCNVGKGKVSSGPNVPVTFNNYMEDKHVPPMSTNERRVIIPAGNTHCNQHICHVKSDQSEGFRRSCVCVCRSQRVVHRSRAAVVGLGREGIFSSRRERVSVSQRGWEAVV